MTQNQIAYQANLENKRANLAREAETHRSNIANEEENKRYHTASVAETNRANLAKEQETNRSNLAKEYETNRSNLANEMLKATQIAEVERSNRANEALKDKDIQTKSRDTRYTADRGYQGRIDAAYINQWGVSKSDASNLVSTIGSGVSKVAPAAKATLKAGATIPVKLGAEALTKPIEIVRGVGNVAQDKVNQVLRRRVKSTKTGVTRKTSGNNNDRRKNNGKGKKFLQQQK